MTDFAANLCAKLAICAVKCGVEAAKNTVAFFAANWEIVLNLQEKQIVMDLIDAIKIRHSVRSYTDEPVSAADLEELRQLADKLNRESGLKMQVVSGDTKAFSGFMAHYGKFRGVSNYIAIVGPKWSSTVEGKAGYYGEQLVLRATQLGLGTCWVGLTYSRNRDAVTVGQSEKLVCVIAFGHAAEPGRGHKIKTREQVSNAGADAPQWFAAGVDAALLAPTAMNQQKFKFKLAPSGKVKASAGFGFFTKVDLGIAKCHFEIGAGIGNFDWD